MNGTALLLVDLQNDYFPGGLYPLHESGTAVRNAAAVLEACRQAGIPVIHVRHESVHPGAKFFFPGTAGAEIHESVRPGESETVVVKRLVSSFRMTRLGKELKSLGAKTLIICGMQTNVCAGTAVREAKKRGFRVALVRDALAAVDGKTHMETVAELETVADLVMEAKEISDAVRSGRVSGLST